MSKGYDYIKPQFRGHEGAVQPGFRGLTFRPAPVTRVELTWKQRWTSLGRLLSPRRWFVGLRLFRGEYWSEFLYGCRYEIHTCAGASCGVLRPSQYCPGSDLKGTP